MSNWQRRTLGTAVVLSVGVSLVACSATSVQESPNGRLIAVSGQASDAQEQALATGTVVWGRGDCMVVEAEETYLIVFPRGTTIGDSEKVTLPNGSVISAGDEVGLGGGFHLASTAKSELSAIPEACLTEEVFWATGEVAE
ncbi:hypothetical protein [Marisediminicola antarctica]|uniref:Lipoprotein n=1 Tax=Marisediminicola antarctica TaxID=674079 RepID=A0A7L5AJ09_9MICO|nr:hypothetical protein [Marisediminicola antarctica]QHO69384.1 hypothetical protein BHD05_06740 [Marisediminicola antarctica]